MGTTAFQEACAAAYGAGEALMKEQGLTLFELPSLSEWLESKTLDEWLSLHGDLVPGSSIRYEVADVICDELIEAGFSDEACHWCLYLEEGDDDALFWDTHLLTREEFRVDDKRRLAIFTADETHIDYLVVPISVTEMGTWLLAAPVLDYGHIKLALTVSSLGQLMDSRSHLMLWHTSDTHISDTLELDQLFHASVADLIEQGFFLSHDYVALPGRELKVRGVAPKGCPRCGASELRVDVKSRTWQRWAGPGDCSGDILEYVESDVLEVVCWNCEAKWQSSYDDELKGA